MNVRRRAIGGILLATMVVVICAIAGAAETAKGKTSDAAANQTVTEDTDSTIQIDLIKHGVAGIVVRLEEFKAEALEEISMTSVSIDRAKKALMAIAQAQDTRTEEEKLWDNRLMAKVEDYLNVREAGDSSTKIVGKLYKGAVAEIVEKGDEWTHIKSGNVDGYVSNDYCVFGQEALAYAKENIDLLATVQTDGLNVRTGPSTENSVITAVYTGISLIVDKDAPTTEGWVALKYGKGTAYVSAEYVTVELDLGVGITIAEEEAAIAKAKAAEEAAKKEAQAQGSPFAQKEAVAVTLDELILMAATIQCEAIGESFEGQIAVGAVIMNRVRSSRFPNTITRIIYQQGQFTPVGNGLVDKVVANGPRSICIRAAQEALNGKDNTGGALFFRRASSGQAGYILGNHVFH